MRPAQPPWLPVHKYPIRMAVSVWLQVVQRPSWHAVLAAVDGGGGNSSSVCLPSTSAMTSQETRSHLSERGMDGGELV